MTTPTIPDDEALLTIEDAIAEFGLREAELVSGIRAGELPHTFKEKVGYRMRRADVRAFVRVVYDRGAGRFPHNTKAPKET